MDQVSQPNDYSDYENYDMDESCGLEASVATSAKPVPTEVTKYRTKGG